MTAFSVATRFALARRRSSGLTSRELRTAAVGESGRAWRFPLQPLRRSVASAKAESTTKGLSSTCSKQTPEELKPKRPQPLPGRSRSFLDNKDAAKVSFSEAVSLQSESGAPQTKHKDPHVKWHRGFLRDRFKLEEDKGLEEAGPRAEGDVTS